MNRYYLVTAKCGHVGRNSCILIDFPVIAKNRKEAARIIKTGPRVKKDHPDCIRDVKEVEAEEYYDCIEDNKKDPYLCCKSKHQQKEHKEIYLRVEPDEYNLKRKEKRTTKNNSLSYRIAKQNNLKNEAIKEMKANL